VVGSAIARMALLLCLGPLTVVGQTPLERGILEEMNRLRRNPGGYAAYLEELLPRFSGTRLEQPGRAALRTEEGAAAVREAIGVLRKTRGMGGLRWSPGLSAAARDHVRDQGPVGGMGHNGQDRSTPAARVNRHGRWRGALAENISYGDGDARDVVVQLLIDDGVPGRGHRRTLLYPDYRVAGVSCGPHASYRQMCVIDYAIRYQEGF